MRASTLISIAIGGGLVIAAGARVARAHFELVAPPAYSVQDGQGLPEKSAPCGQADPDDPVVPTGIVTTFDTGSSITITVDEKIFHPGHYRVSLAADQASLPDDPTVTPDADSPCGTADIEAAPTLPVLADNLFVHTSAFSGPQSTQVSLPPGMTCANCTLQVVEFMSDHGLNAPGGCFYHHCAQVAIVAPGGTRDDGDGCNAGGASSAGLGLLLALGLASRARRRRAIARA